MAEQYLSAGKTELYIYPIFECWKYRTLNLPSSVLVCLTHESSHPKRGHPKCPSEPCQLRAAALLIKHRKTGGTQEGGIRSGAASHWHGNGLLSSHKDLCRAALHSKAQRLLPRNENEVIWMCNKEAFKWGEGPNRALNPNKISLH